MTYRFRFGFAAVASVGLFFLLAAGLFLGLLALRNGVGFYSKASGVNEDPPVQASVEDLKAGVVHSPRVLFITLNPSDSGKNIAEEYFSGWWNGQTLAQVNTKAPIINIKYYRKLTSGRVAFNVVKTINIKTSPKYTNGYTYTVADYDHCVHGGTLTNGLTCEQQKFLFDHNAFIKDNKICSIVNQEAIDEVWLLSVPFIGTWEAWMVGPDLGFGPNGGVYVEPKCHKHFVVMSLVYNKLSPMGHIFGHRIEATLNYLSTNWTSDDRKKYIENFVNGERYSYPYTGGPGDSYPAPGCGNAHFPLNGLQHYDYGQTSGRDFDCPDWNSFPNFSGTTVSMDCTAWGCSDEGWNAKWQAAMPHKAGKTDVNLIDGRKQVIKKDWWFYLLYPDNAITFVKNSTPKGTVSERPGKPFKTVVEKEGVL